jgi:hypothetical protein
MDDDSIRALFVGLVSVAALTFVVGGWAYRIGGTWRDTTRQITLQQWGPIVFGNADFTGGHQRFFGAVFLGRLRLTRWDYGGEHLQSLGFAAAHVAAMQGQTTGYFRLQVVDRQTLAGHFYGRKFSSKGERMVPVGVVPPAPRTWQRTAAEVTHT